MTNPPLPLSGPRLSILGAETERCDAARNRRLLLDAAVRLVEADGADSLTMDAVATLAGVGKGTVFRRFGSRAGLMLAMLDHTERELQQHFLTGPPPLGPGADPIDRIIAFGRARLAIVEVQGGLLRAAENSADSRYSVPAHAVGLIHLSSLLRQTSVDGDITLLAYTLLVSLEATLVLHQLSMPGMTIERIGDGWADLVRRIAQPVDRQPVDHQPSSANVDTAASRSATP